MLWNWNHKFFGTKLRGVYLAVRILFLPKLAIGWPSSSLASSGNSMLKKILRLTTSELSLLPSSDAGSPWCSSGVCGLCPMEFPPESLFFSFRGGPLCRRSIMEWRFLRPRCAETLCVAHLIRFIGADTLPSLWCGGIAIVVLRTVESNTQQHSTRWLQRPTRRRNLVDEKRSFSSGKSSGNWKVISVADA